MKAFRTANGQIIRNTPEDAKELILDSQEGWVESRQDLIKLVLGVVAESDFTNIEIQKHLVRAFKEMLNGTDPAKALFLEGSVSGSSRSIVDYQLRYDVAFFMYLRCGKLPGRTEPRMKIEQAAEAAVEAYSGKDGNRTFSVSTALEYYSSHLSQIRSDLGIFAQKRG